MGFVSGICISAKLSRWRRFRQRVFRKHFFALNEQLLRWLGEYILRPISYYRGKSPLLYINTKRIGADTHQHHRHAKMRTLGKLAILSLSFCWCLMFVLGS
jgi:hypothetical protein